MNQNLEDEINGRNQNIFIIPFVIQTIAYANTSGKSGLSVLADMGSFFYYDKKDDLMV
jgi:hypothetical protein